MRNYDNTGPEMPDDWFTNPDKYKPKISTKDAFTAPKGTVKAPGAAPSTGLSKEGVKNWLKGDGGKKTADIFSKLASQRKESMSGLNPTATHGDSGSTKATLISDEPMEYAKGLNKGNKQETYDEWLKKQRTT
tara:strand:+ start:776 stop:1174 length:399 start_codon:yes stop_codon:yes gene_type:complete